MHFFFGLSNNNVKIQNEREYKIMNNNISVLFVGNSYTYYNDMPHDFFVKEASAAVYSVNVTSITKGGAYLSQFADMKSEQGKKLREIIGGHHYDFAVLQDQSINPIIDEGRFLNSVRNLKELIDAEHFVLYATWGRNAGSPQLVELDLTTEQMTEKLSIAYNKAAQLYNMRVAEVGKAFMNYELRNDLYNADRSHPSSTGSMVAAHVIFETIESFLL